MLDTNRRVPLSIVAWGRSHIAHWAIFVPLEQGEPMGTVVHIGVPAKSGRFPPSTATPTYRKIYDYNMTHSGARRCFVIRNATATLSQVDMVGREVAERYRQEGYNIAIRNCQNFAYHVLARLNQLYPSNVPPEALTAVQRLGTASIYLGNRFDAQPVAQPPSTSSRSVRQRPRDFVID
ncbi:DDT domain protein [Aspergillus terreus]|uniref:DDT domain protein n=1 Tax=Aspergillus terreus TaxID=33178 RepID=A0A5M3YXN6_ASPTE|nr:hypothetical protein ATETN484_0005070800 [Aspergillus terreus]GFF17360.1 DDT domain protein [Aspergillus terreus]